MKLLLKIKYDGAAFHGFQAQPAVKTVQTTLTEAFSALFGEKVNVTGCSRTDAGVHALGAVVSVEAAKKNGECEKELPIPVTKVVKAANSVLDGDVAAVGAALVDDGFHVRYDVVKKEYIYRISTSDVPDPFRRGRVMFYRREISDSAFSKMKEAAGYFIGRRDFASFMASGSKVVSTVRNVFSADVERSGDEVIFKVSADGFLYNMVRIMTGTLLSVAEGKISPEKIPEITESKNRSLVGETVCPDGLYLNEVFYRNEIRWVK